MGLLQEDWAGGAPGRKDVLAQASSSVLVLCAHQRSILSSDSDWWHWEGAGSCRRDWSSRTGCGLELPVVLPGAGAPLRLHRVTFLCIPSDEMNANMTLILSVA